MGIFSKFQDLRGLYFCFQTLRYECKPHNIAYQMKALDSYFSKILIFFEVGQLHMPKRLLTWEHRKKLQIMGPKNGQNAPTSGTMGNILSEFFVHPKHLLWEKGSVWGAMVHIWRANWLFVLRIFQFWPFFVQMPSFF